MKSRASWTPLNATLVCLITIAAAQLGCSDTPEAPFERQPPATDLGVHGYAKGCFAVELYDGGRKVAFINVQDDGYALVGKGPAEAASFTMQPSDLATYLLYDSEGRYFAAEADEQTWRWTRPAILQSVVDRLDESFRSPAEWRLERSVRDPERYQMRHYATDRYLGFDGLTDKAESAAIVTLHPAQDCKPFPELGLDATGQVQAKSWPNGELWGIAEVHSHIFSDAGFGGGGVFHGAPFHRLGVERALPDCSRSHGPEGKRDLMGFFYDKDVSFDLEALLPVATNGQFNEFNHKTDGYPSFSEWPNARKRATHQQMYYRWIERAYLAGLRLIVQHATGNSVMCDLTVATKAQKTLYSCNDMVSVDRTIDRAFELERYIDAQAGGPGKGWLRIVKTPAQARDVIAQGKLAIVLGIEISNLFDCFLSPPPGFDTCDDETVRAKLDHYQKRGVRVIFPVHKYDNGFSAGDGSSGIIEVGNFVNSGHYSNFVQDCPDIATTFDKGGVTFGDLNKPRASYDSKAPFDLSGLADDLLGTLVPHVGALQGDGLKGQWCQNHGLTALGETLVNEMMQRGMIPDLAHLPRRALVRAYELLEQADYPATKTHGDSNNGRIYGLGGLVGTGLGRCADPNNPAAMVQSLQGALAEAADKKAYPAEALSFDFNGFAGGPQPRFGPESGCGPNQSNPITYPFDSVDGQISFLQPHLGERKVDFNTEGMLHIGLLPELLEDAQRGGATTADLEPLFRSAEAYIRMWEKAEVRAKALQP